VEDWAEKFQGFESEDGSPIMKIGITYSNNYGVRTPGVAKLMFEPAVPEPGALCLATAIAACAISTLLLKIHFLE